MKKVGIVVFQNLRYAPFVNYYTNILDNIQDVTYDVIYYNRDRALQEPENESYIGIPWHGKGTNAASKIEKAINFVAYRAHIKKILKHKKYDYIFILMTMPSILLSKYLLKHYNNKYIIDIRDFTQEHFKPYYNIEKKVLSGSALNVISSEGFLNFLPDAEYCRTHNLDESIACKYEKNTTLVKNKDNPVIISYIGMISYEKQCKQLMKLVSLDERFCFHFYGNENTSNQVSEYAETLGCERIKLMGAFTPDKKSEVYEKCDLVFNCYGNDSALVKYAISNKHYDAALFHKPLLVSPNTIMAEIAGDNAYALDLDNLDNLDGLYEWYRNLDEEKYTEYADKLISAAQYDNKTTRESITSAVLREAEV